MYRDEGEVLGIRWPRGLLLHGPPGTGKTMAVHRAAAEHGAQVRRPHNTKTRTMALFCTNTHCYNIAALQSQILPWAPRKAALSMPT